VKPGGAWYALAIMGVTTAIVLAIFAGVFWPHAIKNKQQFYFAIGAVLLIVLFEALDAMIFSTGFHRFAAVVEAFLQIVGILGIILAASGQNVSEFAADTIEVVRRGEEEKEILIKGAGTRKAQPDVGGATPGRIDLGSTEDVPPVIRPHMPPPPPPPSSSGSIPMD
jgi:hypothetical protein